MAFAPAGLAQFTQVTAVAAGYYHTLARASDGSVWVWGLNNYGQLGSLSNAWSNTPIKVPIKLSNISNVAAVAAGANHSLPLTNFGQVKSWGWNAHGQLGSGELLKARALCREALNQIVDHNMRQHLPETLEVTASVVVKEGMSEQAARLLGSAAALRGTHHITRDREEVVSYSLCVEATRARLGAAAFEAIYAEGERLSSEQAVALARSVL